jgi:ankyrin repeat protein
VHILIDAKADVNAQNIYGRTPLMNSVENLEVAKLLIENGADLAKRDEKGSTALHMACEEGEVDVVQLLIDAKADVNAQNNDGRTPLMWVKEGLLAKLLIENGADLEVEDDTGSTTLYYACLRGVEVVHILIDAKADVNAQNIYGRTPLMNSVENLDVAKLLIENGADLAKKDEDGNTALHMACDKGVADVVQLLIDAKADVNARNNDGKTPLINHLVEKK